MRLIISALLITFLGAKGWAQMLIPSTTPVTETMDGMGNSATATTATGFRVSTGTAATNLDYANGSSATTLAGGTTGTGVLSSGSTGGIYNFANGVTASSTDRAVGFLTTGSTSVQGNIMLETQNTTGLYITSITINFNIEKYRSGIRVFNWTFFSGTNGSTWTAQTSGDQNYPADGANTVVHPPTTVSKSVSISGLSIAPNAKYYFRWTHAAVGSPPTNGQALGLDDVVITATTTDPLIITSVSSLSAFANTEVGSSSLEQSYTVSGTNLIANLVVTAPAHYQVSSTSGSGFGSSVTRAPTNGTVSSTTIYVRMHPSAIGTQSGNVTNASTSAVTKNVSVTGFADAQPVCAYSDDFTDNDFSASPVWSGNTGSFAVISTSPVPSGNATTDGAYLTSNTTLGSVAMTTPSTITDEWRFSIASPSFDPSDNNYLGVILMSDVSLSAGGDVTINGSGPAWNGYFLRIGDDGPGTDKIKLYRRTSTASTLVGEFSSPSFSTTGLRNGLNLRVTRSGTGDFEVFYSTGFLNEVVPTTSAGTLNSTNHTTSNYFGVFQKINSADPSRRVYFDNFCTFDRTYTWLPTSGTTSWTTPTNWSPPRTSPAATDILLFNQGGSSIAINIPTTETVKQLNISNTTQISLRSATASGSILTINGSPNGDDFVVGSGSKLVFDSNPGAGAQYPIIISLATGITGSIAGNITFDRTSGNLPAHQLLTNGTSIITFNSGGVFYAKDFTGFPFDNTLPLNSHIFASGSTYISESGSNPFARSQPESKVVFQTGSLYLHKQSATAPPSLGGRVYANFELDITGASTIASGSAAAVTMDNIIITNGTLNVTLTTNNVAQNFDVKGNLSVASGATFNYSPTNTTAASTFTFNGSFAHDISGSGNITFGSNATVEVSSDITLIGAFPNVDGTLNRTAGIVGATGGGAFTYGGNSTLNFNGSTSLNATTEWPSTGSSSAGPGIININNGNTVTIPSSKEVKGILAVKTGSSLSTGGNLTLQSGASLLHGTGTPLGGGTVTGNITVKRTGNSGGNFFNYWCSPVTGADVSALGSRLYYYEPANATDLTENGLKAGWITASGTMTQAVGYISTNGATVSFTGTAGNAPTGTPITVNVKKNVGTSNNVPWNLVGNPFPSGLDADAFINVNGPTGSGAIAGSLYFWDDDNSGGATWTTNDYAVWNKAGTIPCALCPSSSGNAPNGHIATGQSFFVNKTNDGTSSLQFQNSMRSSTNNIFFRQAPIERFWVNITNPNNEINETLIAFIDDATDSVDLLYDAEKLKGNAFISVYTKINNDDFAIQALPELTADRVIALGMNAGAAGNHTLRLSYNENLDETVILTLEDRLLNYFQNLNENPEYIFHTDAGIDISRFYIHINPPVQINVTEETCSGLDAEISIFQPGSKTWDYILYDDAGQLITSGTGFNGNLFFSGLTGGDYHLELTDQSGFSISKDITVTGKTSVAAFFNPDFSVVSTDQPIHFSNSSTGATSFDWNFGDGTTIMGVAEPDHAYTEEGNYTVTLNAYNNDCGDVITQDISVYKIATGNQGLDDDKIFVSTIGEYILIHFDYRAEKPVELTIHNTLGQKVYESATVSAGDLRIDLPGKNEQCYFLTVKDNSKSLSAKIILFGN